MASPSKPPLDSSDQAKELAETLENLTLRGISFVDSFMNQLRTALSRKSETFRPPAQVNSPQANLHDGEKLEAAEPSLFPSLSFGSQFHETVSANQNFVVEPSKSSPDSDDQASELAGTLKNLAVLGLRLDKDDSFKNQAQTALSQKSKLFCLPAKGKNPQTNLSDKEKLKAGHVPATLIKIGSWQFTSAREADLVGKFYFTTRKLVWEVLANGVKNKMEIQWSDISAIRATIEENKPGILEIELRQPPTLYKETDPQARHHSLCILTDDFTGGQALMCRRHYLEFPSAALDRNYIMLLSSDHQLLELSQSGFPSSAEMTFCTLQNSDFENSRVTQVSNNLSQFEALPPLRPAAPADSALYLREHLNSPYVGEAGIPTLKTPAIMRNTLGQLLLDLDPISWYNPKLPPAINGTFTSPIGSSNAVGSASNGEAMGVQQEHDGYANNSEKFIDPSEQNETFTSPIGLSNAGGSASNGDAVGVKQEHDGYANSNGQFNFGYSASQGQTKEQLASLMRHQAYEQKPLNGSP